MSEIGLFEAIYSTRSMRRLKPDPIEPEVLEKILDAGVHAPSGSNFQNWAFLIVREQEDKRFIRDRYLKYYRELERLVSIPSMDQIPPDASGKTRAVISCRRQPSPARANDARQGS